MKKTCLALGFGVFFSAAYSSLHHLNESFLDGKNWGNRLSSLQNIYHSGNIEDIQKKAVTASPPHRCHRHQSTTCIQWPQRQKVNLFRAMHKGAAERGPCLRRTDCDAYVCAGHPSCGAAAGFSLFISFQLGRGKLIKILPAGGPCRPL